MSKTISIETSRVIDQVAAVPRVRAERMAPISGKNGGTLHPFAPGNGMAARGGSWKAIRKSALARLAEFMEAAAEETARLALESPDDRVRTINLQEILNRTLGKPGEVPQVTDDTPRTGIKAQFLTADERAEVMAALCTMQRLSAVAQSRADAAGEAEQ